MSAPSIDRQQSPTIQIEAPDNERSHGADAPVQAGTGNEGAEGSKPTSHYSICLLAILEHPLANT